MASPSLWPLRQHYGLSASRLLSHSFGFLAALPFGFRPPGFLAALPFGFRPPGFLAVRLPSHSEDQTCNAIALAQVLPVILGIIVALGNAARTGSMDPRGRPKWKD